jgi:hypothetical protein
MSETVSTQTSAIEYRERGWSPIRLKGKIPSEPWAEHQQRRMTTEEIEAKPWRDVGIVTGAISGIVVLDADSPEAVEELKRRGHPATPMVQTARGLHAYFKHPGVTLPTRVGVGEGLDLKGDGGYVAAPPTRHPSGSVYQWLISPDDSDLAELPGWILEAAAANARGSHNGPVDMAAVLEGVPDGMRDTTLFRAASKLRGADVPYAMARRVILEAAANCTPPFPEPVALEKVDSAYSRYEPNKNGSVLHATNLVSSSLDPPVYFDDDDTSDEPEIVWFAELGEPKEREYLIEKIGVKGYPIVAFGAGGVAKSFAMLSAGLVIASASGVDDWLGLRVKDHGYVLYMDFELDVEEQHRRVRDLCAGMGIPVPKKIAYLSGVGISPETAFRKAVAFVKKYGAKAVIIDSMGLAMQGDMEKGKEVLAFHGRYINPLRRAGATPFIVDHEGKLQTGEKHKDKMPFGSAYKAWASRSVLQFTFEEYREKDSELDIRVRQTKSNFGPKIDPIGLRFTFEEKKVSMGLYDLPDEELLEEETRPVRERILTALKLEGATTKQLSQITGAAEGTIRNKLSELRSDGLIEEDGKRPVTYTLVSSSSKYTGGSSDDDTREREISRLVGEGMAEHIARDEVLGNGWVP